MIHIHHIPLIIYNMYNVFDFHKWIWQLWLFYLTTFWIKTRFTRSNYKLIELSFIIIFVSVENKLFTTNLNSTFVYKFYLISSICFFITNTKLLILKFIEFKGRNIFNFSTRTLTPRVRCLHIWTYTPFICTRYISKRFRTIFFHANILYNLLFYLTL